MLAGYNIISHRFIMGKAEKEFGFSFPVHQVCITCALKVFNWTALLPQGGEAGQRADTQGLTASPVCCCPYEVEGWPIEDSGTYELGDSDV